MPPTPLTAAGEPGRERLDPSSPELTDLDLRGAFEHAPTGMALVSPAGQVIACNAALSELLGRSTGELVGGTLFEVTQVRLTGLLRPGDTAARLGGDEFVVLCEDIDEQQAALVAERVRAAAAWPFDLSGRRVTIGASVGVSTFVSGDVTADELLRQADLRMYAAKRARRAPSRDPRH